MSKLTFKQRRDYVLEQLEQHSLAYIEKSKIPRHEHSAGYLAFELKQYFDKQHIEDHMRFIDLIYYANPYEESLCYKHIGGNGFFVHKGSFRDYENYNIRDILRNRELPEPIFKIFEGYFDTSLKDIPMYSSLKDVHKNLFRICLYRLGNFSLDHYDVFENTEIKDEANNYIFRYDRYRGVMDRVIRLYMPLRTFNEGVFNQFNCLYTESNANYSDFNFDSIRNKFDLVASDFIKNSNKFDENKKLLFQFICFLVESKLNDFKDTVVFDIHYDICFALIEAIHLYNNYKPIDFKIHGYTWNDLYYNIERKVTLMNNLDTLMDEIKDDTFKNLFCTMDTVNEIKDCYSKKAFLQLYSGCRKLNINLNVDENIIVDESLLKSILKVCDDIIKEPIQYAIDMGVEEFCESLGSVDYDFCTIVEALVLHYNIDLQESDDSNIRNASNDDNNIGSNMVLDQSINNGGKTDYYKIDPKWEMLQDVIEDRNMNFSQGNILKAAFCFNTDRHSGTNYERELNKIIYFAQRELNRIK